VELAPSSKSEVQKVLNRPPLLSLRLVSIGQLGKERHHLVLNIQDALLGSQHSFSNSGRCESVGDL